MNIQNIFPEIESQPDEPIILLSFGDPETKD